MNADTEKVLTMRELEAETGLNYWLIQKLAKAGQIPHLRLGKRVLFRLSTVKEWLAKKEAASVQKEQHEVERFGELRRIR